MDVKVTATGLADGSIEWDIDGKKPRDSRVEFKANTGPHQVKFKLINNTRSNVGFDTSGPFWSHKHDRDCPPRDSLSDQTEVVECTHRELSVTNKNSGQPCTIHYQLNFVDSCGQRHEVDPEFKNGGGN